MCEYEWRGVVGNEELEALHAEGFGHPPVEHDWGAQLGRHSLGWVCARREGALIGFVNVAWDGGDHAFILDTLVSASERSRGTGTRLVGLAVTESARAGCAWLHVDFEEPLTSFYLDACHFRPTGAGLIRLG